MKCFLINPNYPQRHPFLFPIPPMGLAYIAAVMESAGHLVRIEDQFASGQSNQNLVKEILDFEPDVVGISCLTPTIPHTAELCHLLKKSGFSGKILMGGVHPTLFYESILEDGIADIVALGEAEETVGQLMEALESRSPLDDIPGLAFRDPAGKIIKTQNRPQNKDLDSLPFPAWHLLNLDMYTATPLLQFYGRVLPVQGSRGCPERCIFCGQERFFKKMSTRSISSIMNEIDQLVDKYNIKYFVFLDANFPQSKQYGLDFCRAFSSSRHWPEIKWCCEIKVDMVDEELLTAMKNAGCHTIEYGFEVGDPDILESLRKRTTIDDAFRAMEITRKTGIHTLGLFMIGLPGEGVSEIFKTFRFARQLKCDLVKFNVTIPQPGSELFERNKDRLLKDFHPETYTSWYRPGRGEPPMTTIPGALSVKKLMILQAVGMLLFYARPSFIFRFLRQKDLPIKDMFRGAGFLFAELFKNLKT